MTSPVYPLNSHFIKCHWYTDITPSVSRVIRLSTRYAGNFPIESFITSLKTCFDDKLSCWACRLIKKSLTTAFLWAINASNKTSFITGEEEGKLITPRKVNNEVINPSIYPPIISQICRQFMKKFLFKSKSSLDDQTLNHEALNSCQLSS